MTWGHIFDAAIFAAGMLCAFALAIWVESRSDHYRRDFDARYRRDRDDYRFDEHCHTAGVRDRRNLLPGRWAA